MTDGPDPEEWRFPRESFSYADAYLAAAGAPLLVALHGYGGNKRSMARLARPALPDGFSLVSLQGPYPHLVRPEDRAKPLGFGFGWVTNWKPEQAIAVHHAAIDALIARYRAAGGVSSDVFLLGFSQSVALNFRYAFTFPGRVRGVVAVAGGIPGDWDADGKYRDAPLDVLYVAGRRDEFYPPERIDGNARSLERRGARVEVVVLECGHDFPPEAAPIVREWLAARVAIPAPRA